MALIKCPECNNEISDKAATCIHCGYPLPGKDAIKATGNKNNNNKKFSFKNISKRSKALLAISTVLIIGVIVFCCKRTHFRTPRAF